MPGLKWHQRQGGIAGGLGATTMATFRTATIARPRNYRPKGPLPRLTTSRLGGNGGGLVHADAQRGQAGMLAAIVIAQLGVDLQHLVSGWRDYARWGRFLKPAPYTAAAATTAACLLVLADSGLLTGQPADIRRLDRQPPADGAALAARRATVHRVLERNGLIVPQEQRHKRKYKRWQRETPMALWQLDLVGGIYLADGRECKMLSGIDDHSRFVVCCAVLAVSSGRAVADAFTGRRASSVPGPVAAGRGRRVRDGHLTVRGAQRAAPRPAAQTRPGDGRAGRPHLGGRGHRPRDHRREARQDECRRA